MNNVLIPDKTIQSQAIEIQVLENRDKQIHNIKFQRLLNILPILGSCTPLHELPAQTAPLLNSMSSLYDFITFTSKVKEQNIVKAAGTLELIDFPIWPPYIWHIPKVYHKVILILLLFAI
jgi:hypothetical protein